ncbi:DNA-binding protein YbaB [Actinoalloteichus hoggarensis]|nr:YbaB/EbfC family nucleoid-associated protein [Actinoalloteichus hoggarensis]MBB5921145.1 DNA-binding protein YbaB [Actinoalloteichus hoggarensis]
MTDQPYSSRDPIDGLRRSLTNTVGDLTRMQEAIDAQLTEVRTRTEELRTRRFEASADSRRAHAVVDGEGFLQELRIDPGSLRSSHPGQLGGEIVQAVSRTRAAASEENRKTFQGLMPAMFPAGGVS